MNRQPVVKMDTLAVERYLLRLLERGPVNLGQVMREKFTTDSDVVVIHAMCRLSRRGVARLSQDCRLWTLAENTTNGVK